MIPRGGAVVALASLCACAGEPRGPVPLAPVRLALVGGVSTLDPARSGWAIESRLFGQLADGLVETDAHLQVRPSLAESWQLDGGGRRYRFVLRADATWGDGQPLRAADAVRALTRLALADNHMGWPVVSEIEGAEAYRAGRASTVTGLVAVDPRTLEIRLQAPNARFLQLLGGGAARLFPGDGSRADWDAGRVAGSGPFVLRADTRERVAGAEVRRFRFARRPGAHRPAQVAEAVWDVYRSAGELVRGLDGGGYDIAYAPPVARDVLADGAHGLQQRQAFRFAFLSLYFDCQKPPFDRAAVRRAIVLAADRDALPASAATGAVPLPGVMPEDAVLPRDPAAALAVAREAGLDAGRPVTLRVAYSAAHEYGDVGRWVTEKLPASLRPIGVVVEPVAVADGQALDERFFARQDHAYVYGSTPEAADPCLFFEPFRAGNLAYNWAWYARPEVDAAYARCRASSDAAEQALLIEQSRALIAQDAPILPMGPAFQRILTSARLRGFTPSPLEGLDLRGVSLAPP